MEITLSEDWLKQLYNVLIVIYKGTEDPIKSGFPIVTDYNSALLNVCVNRPHTRLFGKTIYPHILHKATVNLHSIINFHPFVDGNKRVALLSTYYYLLWNGYTFRMPYDADVFTIRVAREHLGLGPIFNWLKRHTSRSIDNVIRQWACKTLSENGKVSASKVFVNQTLLSIYLPREGLLFFRYKIMEQKNKQKPKKIN